MTDLKPETAGNAPEPWMPIVQQIHSHKPILACPKCNATSDRQASKMCSGNEDNCPMDGADWIERIVKLNIETIASGFFGDPSGASSQEATPRKCDCGADQDDEDVRCWRCGAEPAPSPEENELNDFLANFDCPCCGFPKCGHEHEADVQALFQAEIDRLKAICAKSKEPAPSPATKETPPRKQQALSCIMSRSDITKEKALGLAFDAGAKSVVAAPQLEKENDNATK